MAILTRRRADVGAPPAAPPGLVASPMTAGPRKRYRPARIALGVVLMVVVGLAALYLYRSASQSVAVVQVRSTIARGQVIGTADLTTVTIGTTPGVPTVPAEQLTGMVGKRALWDLTAGTLLSPAQVTDSPQPAKGRSQIGLQLAPGRTVPGDLAAGTQLRLIVTTPEGNPVFGGGPAANGTAFQAVLVNSGVSADGNGTLTTVDVKSGQAALVAQLAAQGRLAVVVDSSER